MVEEESNIALSKGILVTTVSFLINMPREALEKKLKESEYVDEFEIENLDDEDKRKDVFIILKNPVEIRYLSNIIAEIIE